MENSMSNYRVSTDQNDFDFEFIYQFISKSYWAKGIPKATLEKALANSLCFAVLDSHNIQCGFARLITDRATFAYLADVFIDENYQGQGLSKLLMQTIVTYPDVIGLRRMMLATRDAHGLYEKYGFEPIKNADSLMQIWQPDVYQS